ncbi:MAG: glycoside hydrolase TIM-barrel-like domain-containing protein, partial [Pseudolabrys sp.]|nr:glycoside hydrolase TIM-barrel-like domain-containing protein [Pseudolabrys sp.]
AHGASDDFNPVSTVYDGRMIAPDAIHLWTWDARPYPVFPAALDVWSDGGNWDTGHWLTGRLGGAPLDALIETLLSDSGIDDVETSALRDTAEGYVVDRPMSPREMIDPLALMYGFDASEEGGRLSFVQRGGAPLAEFDEDALVLPDDTAPVKLSRAEETELPREVTLSYTDAGSDYRRAAIASRRLVGGSVRTSHADLAVVTNDAAASRRADIWLQDLWAGRERADFALPPSALRIGPGDVVALTANGRRRLLEIQSVSDAESRATQARSIDPEVFDLPLAAPRRRTPAIPAAIAPVHAAVLDLPTLDTSDPPVLTRLGVFADPWPGPVAVWRSADGLSFSRLALALAPAIVGETLDDLPPGPVSRFDHHNAVRVRLSGGALSSLSDALVLGGGNVAAVCHDDGSWEVLQFANAELVADKTYRLSRLLRGQAGSEWTLGAPSSAGAAFVILDQNLVTLARGSDALERAMDLRAIVAGRDYADPATLALDVTPQALALKPLSPVHLKARRSGSGVTLSWIRRTRSDGDGWGVQDVPLGEEREAYEVDILSGSVVLRTLTSEMPQALYSSASEFADFGSAQSVLSVAVYQLSATVGRGIAATAILTP